MCGLPKVKSRRSERRWRKRKAMSALSVACHSQRRMGPPLTMTTLRELYELSSTVRATVSKAASSSSPNERMLDLARRTTLYGSASITLSTSPHKPT